MANHFPHIGSIRTISKEYVLVKGEGDPKGCQHTCTHNGAIDSVTIHMGQANSECIRLKFVYGDKVLFEEFCPLESLDISMDFLRKPLLVAKGGLVAMYARTTDEAKPVSVVGAFDLRE